ncbi:MAG: (2Fe-2S)-binding protein [Planctomycetes bacterium]|nr:(2Fe-2S)-binding protein [Planctomycetota bacterium]
MITLRLNGEDVAVDVPPEMPLLWVLRDVLQLTGTKFACGIGACGTCTLLVDGQARRSCVLPVGEVRGEITTIEGLGREGQHPVQAAWIAESVPQCGYCQPAQILAAVALLGADPDPGEEAVQAAMDAVLCRCGTYPRIRKAIDRCRRR